MKRNNIFITIYMFLFIFTPWLLTVNVSHLLTLYAILMLLTKYKFKPKIILETKLYIIFIFIGLLTAYVFLLMIINKNFSIVSFYPYFLLLFEIPICILYIASYIKYNRVDFKKFINLIILIGMAQAFFSIVMYLFPSIKTEIINYLFSNTSGDASLIQKLRNNSLYRMNGLSGDMLFTTPIVQSVIASIALYYAINSNIKYIICLPFLIFSAITNSRTSIITFLLGVILVLIYSKKTLKNYSKISTLALLIIIALPVLLTVIADNTQTMSWLQQGFDDILAFITGRKKTYGYFAVLKNFFHLPNNVDFLVGTGEDIFYGQVKYGFNSDIGYINDIWRGGIIYAIVFSGVFVIYYLKLLLNNKLYSFLSILFAITFCLANFKGRLLGYNDFMAFSLLVTSVALVVNSTKKFEYLGGKNEF